MADNNRGHRPGIRAQLASLLTGTCMLTCTPMTWAQVQVRILPGAIQKPDVPMRIEVGPLSTDDQVEFSIQQQCRQSACPIIPAKYDFSRRLERLNATLDLSSTSIPKDAPLILRTIVHSVSGDSRKATVFSVSSSRCGVFSTFVPWLGSQGCKEGFGKGLAGLHWAQPAGVDVATTVAVLQGNNLRSIASSRTATGLAWLTDSTIAFTATSPPLTAREIGDGVSQPIAGLYSVSLDGRNRKLLLATENKVPTAPLVTPDGRVLIIATGQDGTQSLLVWKDDQPLGSVELRDRIEPPIRALSVGTVDDEEHLLLVGTKENSTILARIGTRHGEVTFLPYEASLEILASRRMPDGLWPASIATLTSSGGDLDIVGVTEDGANRRMLISSEGDQIFPVVSAEGVMACLSREP